MTEADVRLLDQIWWSLAGEHCPVPVSFSGPLRVLPSVYDVSALASATVGAATASVAALWAARTGGAPRAVHVDRVHAAVAFRSERYVAPIGWTTPSGWDPVAEDYHVGDGWVRLHTNYRYHRDAVMRVLGTAESREAVANAARSWGADALEAAVVAEGGCAARSRTTAEWNGHPQGAAVAREPLFRSTSSPTDDFGLPVPRGAPLEGARVLDLTRVDAYGFTGPWASRRGFDSLVQMSSGIADRGREASGADRPFPLPAQALDHGCGYLLAAAAARGLTRALGEGQATTFQLSLARVAKLLTDQGDDGDIGGPDVRADDIERCRETAESGFGSIRRVRCPGRIEGTEPHWAIPAGPLGSDAPVWG